MARARSYFTGFSVAAILQLLVGTGAATAGDIDTHLAATYFLARQVGFNHRDARLIAAGDWSLDLNGGSTALPVKHGASWEARGDLHDPVGKWQERGRRFHLLADSATEAHANLVQLKRDFEASSATGDTRLRQLGQYLHAAQDAYFHQHDGVPYGPKWGHLASGDGGHAADSVRKHFGSALRANEMTYEILKHYHANNGALPEVPAADKIYNKSGITADERRSIVANNKDSNVWSLTRAIDNSYRADGKLNPDLLDKNLKATWKGEGQIFPPTRMEIESGFKVDYDRKDEDQLLKDTSPIKTIPVTVPIQGQFVTMQVQVRAPNGYTPPFPTLPPGLPGSLTPTAAPSSPGGPSPGGLSPGKPPQVGPAPGGPAQAAPSPSKPAQVGASPGQPAQAGPLPGKAAKVVPSPVGQMIPTSATGVPKPGGISLSMAAASRLALKIRLDGVHAQDGRLVLTGHADTAQIADAGLLFTALRAACEPNDPYMSLDPDNGRAWWEEGERAGKEVWARIKGDFGVDKPLTVSTPEGLVVRTISVRRDYPQVWTALERAYPNLRARLVFKPDWLRETRFGEIMYVADVLLKELSAGIPTLQQGSEVRAVKIDGYQSSDLRGVLRGLTESVGSLPSTASSVRSFRLWFDLAPDGRDPNAPAVLADAVSLLDDTKASASDPASVKLRALIKARGYTSSQGGPKLTRALAVSEGAMDLSQVWPQMFVRGHDHATRTDIQGMDYALLSLSEDVNRRVAAYAAAYKELRDLAEVFRLYVAAVGIVNRDRNACESVRATPLLAAERAARELPSHHPTELAFTVASFTHKNTDGKRRWYYQTHTFNGGVSPRGREFFEKEAMLPAETNLTREIREEVAARSTDIAWAGKAGRQYVALQLDNDPEFLEAMRRIASFKPMTRKMVLANHPELAMLDGPAETPGTGGLLDAPAEPAAAAPAARPDGLLDDVDATEGRTIVVPPR